MASGSSRSCGATHARGQSGGAQLDALRRLAYHRFRDILIQCYLYGSLDEVVRAYQHEAVEHTLEMPYGAQAIEVAAQLAWHFEVAQLQRRPRCTTIRRATRPGIRRHWMRLSGPTRRRSNSGPRSIAQPARPRCAAMRASRRRCPWRSCTAPDSRPFEVKSSVVKSTRRRRARRRARRLRCPSCAGCAIGGSPVSSPEHWRSHDGTPEAVRSRPAAPGAR